MYLDGSGERRERRNYFVYTAYRIWQDWDTVHEMKPKVKPRMKL